MQSALVHYLQFLRLPWRPGPVVLGDLLGSLSGTVVPSWSESVLLPRAAGCRSIGRIRIVSFTVPPIEEESSGLRPVASVLYRPVCGHLRYLQNGRESGVTVDHVSSLVGHVFSVRRSSFTDAYRSIFTRLCNEEDLQPAGNQSCDTV